MPTYEYLCNECSHRFEEFQSITAAPLESCPKCKGKVHRLISPGNGLIFKGSGFYITDYKNAGNSSQSQTKGETKSETKEAKPDTKTDTISSSSDSK